MASGECRVKCIYGEEDGDGNWRPKGSGSISRQADVQRLAIEQNVAVDEYDVWLAGPIDPNDELIATAFSDDDERKRFISSGAWSLTKRVKLVRALKSRKPKVGADERKSLFDEAELRRIAARAETESEEEVADGDRAAYEVSVLLTHYDPTTKKARTIALPIEDARLGALHDPLREMTKPYWVFREPPVLATLRALNELSKLVSVKGKDGKSAVTDITATEKSFTAGTYLPETLSSVVSEITADGIEGMPNATFTLTDEALAEVVKQYDFFRGRLSLVVGEKSVYLNTDTAGSYEAVVKELNAELTSEHEQKGRASAAIPPSSKGGTGSKN